MSLSLSRRKSERERERDSHGDGNTDNDICGVARKLKSALIGGYLAEKTGRRRLISPRVKRKGL